MPGYTDNYQLPYPLGSERPSASQIVALAQTTDAELAKTNAIVAALRNDREWEPVTSGPQFTQVESHEPAICVRAGIAHIDGLLTWSQGVFAGTRMAGIPSYARPSRTIHLGGLRSMQGGGFLFQLWVTTGGILYCPSTSYYWGTPTMNKIFEISGSWPVG